MDTAHRHMERLIMRAIQGDIQAAMARGEQPLPIPPLLPVPGEDADQGAGDLRHSGSGALRHHSGSIGLGSLYFSCILTVYVF
ncbi:hypothetical protein HanIR_Chr02g0069911 [Helianthus annuus]|nr:hypothetical protein HanIR_Chr02g0069911 [Helianthus annuus]